MDFDTFFDQIHITLDTNMWEPEKNIYQQIGLTQIVPAIGPTVGLIRPTPVYKMKGPHII